MLRIVDMKRAGVFVVMNDGSLANVEGRSHWYALEEVKSALQRNGLTAVERVLRTNAL